MDGYEAARQLRAGPLGGSLILVAVTGWGQPEHVEKSRHAGFDAHLTKPVNPEDLLRLIARLKRQAPGPQEQAVSA